LILDHQGWAVAGCQRLREAESGGRKSNRKTKMLLGFKRNFVFQQRAALPVHDGRWLVC